jgi:hypothetical protein
MISKNNTNTNSFEVSENIKKLLELKNSTYNEIYSQENEIKRLKKTLEQIEYKLMDICAHQWEYDSCYGMYEKPDKVCKLCESRIYRF